MTLATAAILGGAGISALASASQGNAAKAESDFNAAMSRQQAMNAQQVARSNEQDFRRQQSRAAASRRAAMGASGVNIGTGSPLLVSSDLEREVELQAQRIRHGGQVASTRLEQQAQLQQQAGRNLQSAGYLRAGSSLLTGYARAYG